VWGWPMEGMRIWLTGIGQPHAGFAQRAVQSDARSRTKLLQSRQPATVGAPTHSRCMQLEATSWRTSSSQR
jgi:hypothetical protein